VPLLIVVMLGSLAASQAIGQFSQAIGVDFYNFWGVPVAMRLTGGALGPPYRNGERYLAVLKDYGGTVGQPRLKAAQRFWSGPDYTGSPLLYRVFGVVSDDYTLALGAFRTLQIIAFLAAALFLGYLYRLDPFHSLSFALICLLLYQPLLSDLRVANLGSLQFAALAALTGVAQALPRVRAFGRRAALAGVLAAGLAALTLCKPNVALVAVFLAVHLVVRHGVGIFALAALPALGATVALLIVPCVYFGSWTVWQEWYRFVYGANARMLVRPVENGNYSTPLLASSWLGVDLAVVAAVLACVLVGSLVVCRVGALAPRPAWRAARAALGRLLGDPHHAVGAAILLTLATSPLAWVHYYMLVLIPSLWLLGAASTSSAVPILAAASVAMSAGVAGMLLWALGWPGAMPATIALSWLPLWAALLIKLRAPDVDTPVVATSAAPKPSRRRT
jgi:hypothetical protein